MVERLKLLPRYLINLGLIEGFFVFVQVELFSLNKIRIPQYEHPVFLRPNTSDRQVFREVFLFRIYAFGLKEMPHVILDGGANIGLSSIYFANRYKDAIIWAVEPEGSNLEALKKNVLQYNQIKIVESALWNTDTFLKIKNSNESKWSFAVEECSSLEPGAFKGISIQSILTQEKIENVDLLKLDIEGAEKELFERRVDKWLPKVSNMAVELHDWMKPGCSASLFSAMAGYRISVSIHQGLLLIRDIKLI